jgi:anti-sigma factor (TIGR02949 family)
MTGASDPIDCRQAAAQLYEFLDGELTPAADAAVRSHLADCAHCLALHDFEQAYLRFLAMRLRAQGAPPHVQRRILRELFE